MKLRKKPVIVDGVQWFKDGDHPNVQPSSAAHWLWANTTWYHGNILERNDGICDQCGKYVHEHGWIGTLEGGHVVCPGDWIITGVHGEQYPCKPDIKILTYDEVESDITLTEDK